MGQRQHDGNISYFSLPTHASLTPIPIEFSRSGWGFDSEIILLGSGHMKLRLPEAIFLNDEDEEADDESFARMIEFVGIRTDQD